MPGPIGGSRARLPSLAPKEPAQRVPSPAYLGRPCAHPAAAYRGTLESRRCGPESDPSCPLWFLCLVWGSEGQVGTSRRKCGSVFFLWSPPQPGSPRSSCCKGARCRVGFVVWTCLGPLPRTALSPWLVKDGGVDPPRLRLSWALELAAVYVLDSGPCAFDPEGQRVGSWGAEAGGGGPCSGCELPTQATVGLSSDAVAGHGASGLRSLF